MTDAVNLIMMIVVVVVVVMKIVTELKCLKWGGVGASCVNLFPVVLCQNVCFLEDDGHIWLKHVADMYDKLLCLE
jgi:hypothetical protein